MNRRDFIKLGVVGTGAALAGVDSVSGENIPSKTSATMVAMPISVAPLAQRELDPMFNDMRERAGVNALFPFMYTHEPHRAGAAVAGFHGGNYATPHIQLTSPAQRNSSLARMSSSHSNTFLSYRLAALRK